LGDPSQLSILGIRVWSVIRTLKLDADGKIVTAATTLIFGVTSVPGSLVKGDELNRLTRAIDQQIRRDLQIRDFLEVRMSARIELIAEELLNVGSSKTTGREADAMNDQDVNF
jgi:hypothetical protein